MRVYVCTYTRICEEEARGGSSAEWKHLRSINEARARVKTRPGHKHQLRAADFRSMMMCTRIYTHTHTHTHTYTYNEYYIGGGGIQLEREQAED